MGVITVRIPEDLRKRMKRLKNVNWSEVVREAILERILVEEKLVGKDWSLVRKAAEEMDELRKMIEARDGKCDYDSAETIRNWRDIRSWKG